MALVKDGWEGIDLEWSADQVKAAVEEGPMRIKVAGAQGRMSALRRVSRGANPYGESDDELRRAWDRAWVATQKRVSGVMTSVMRQLAEEVS